MMKDLLAFIIVALMNGFSVLITLLIAAGILKIADMFFGTNLLNETMIVTFAIILCIEGRLKLFELKKKAEEKR